MSAKNAHPNIYPTVVSLSQRRAAGALQIARPMRESYLRREFAALDKDEVGFEGRMDYSHTITHVWEKFIKSDRIMYRMADRLPPIEGLSSIVISELPALRLPDVFYAHYGQELGLHLDEHPNVYVDGVYFMHTTVTGQPTYLYVVVCGELNADYETMSMGELTIAKTRAAIGTVDPTQQLSDTFDDMIGDPAVCRTVRDTALKDILALTLALIAHPNAAPDLLKEVNVSPRMSPRAFQG